MEQALVFASIVLGVAVAFELTNLDTVLRSDKVKWHWAQPVFAAFVLLSIIAYWWMAASRAEGPITLGQFLPIMFQLVMLVLLASVSLPNKVPDEGIDLADYYRKNQRYQWILCSLYLWSIHIGYLIYSWQNAASFTRFVQAVSIDTAAALVMIAMIFTKHWWQVALGFVFLSIGPIFWISRTL